MAFLAQDDKQLQTGQDPNAQNTQSAPIGGAVVGGSAPGATVGGQAVSTAGVGKGGAGGWTNIQAYLGANQGNKEQSAQKLQSTVGTQFNQEKTQLNTQADATESKAKQQVEQNKIGQDQASQMIEKMGANYQYPQVQNQVAAPQDYTQSRDKFRSALSAQYQGPDSFAYGMDAKTQQYGSQLQNDDTFKGLMGDVYNQAAGGYLGKGGKTLQNQLDNGNEHLASARSQLLGDYAGLNDSVTGRVAQANQTIADSRTGVDQNKSALMSYLTGAKDTRVGNIDKAVTEYKAADQARAKNSGDIYWSQDAMNAAAARGSQDAGKQMSVRDLGPFLGNGYHIGGVNEDAFGKKAANVDELRAPISGMQQMSGVWGDGLSNFEAGITQNLSKYRDNRDAYYDPSTTRFAESNASRESKGLADKDRAEFNAILDALGLNAGALGQRTDLNQGKFEITDPDSILKYIGAK